MRHVSDADDTPMQLGLFSAIPEVGRRFWLDARWPEPAARQDPLERVEIEVGPGNCGFLRAAALAAPQTLFVGIEWLPSSVARAHRAGPFPPNLRLLEGDASWMILHMLEDRSIDAFHVYFPDPWWKKKHHKRRFFQPEICTKLARVLVPGGAVYVVTDVVPLFAEIRERMEAAGFRPEPWERPQLAPSAYESKYLRQGRRFEQALFRIA